MEQEFNKAVEKFQAGQYKQAEKILLKLNKRQPGIPDVAHMLAYIAMEMDKPEVAAEYLSKLVESVTNDAGLFNLLGSARRRQGKVDDAIEAFAKAVSLAPDLVDARFNLASALLNADRLEEAEAEFRRSLELAPDDAESHYNLGAILGGWQRLDEAEQHLSRALEINPDMPKALYFLADVLRNKGNPEAAMSVLSKALVLTPGSHNLHRLQGVLYQILEQNEEALASYGQARQLKPDDTETLLALSGFLEKASKLDQAAEAVAEGLETAPDNFGLNLIAAKLAYRAGEFDKALGLLDAMTAEDETPLNLQRDRYFELGRVYDRIEESEKAFEAYTQGNGIAARSWPSQEGANNEMVEYVNRLSEVATKPWVSSWTPPFDGKDNYPSPVFLIGFPRSGTTLLDQILDSHPGIQVLEELPIIIQVRAFLEKQGGYPESLASLSSEDIAKLRRLYFEIADKSTERIEGQILIDKMPLNTVEAALIHRLFPDAKFIFSLRHPCDVVLSCFMQSFVLNAGMANFLTLEGAVNLYERVMTLWRRYQSRLPLSVFKIRYEDLVDDMEGTVRELLDFLDLPWDDAMQDYHRHAQNRNINTPSYSQVTQKIYTRARYRWLRYEKFIDPLLDRLEPFIDEFGYGKT
jgi:tetratricopeptide (TPR) repeat protein